MTALSWVLLALVLVTAAVCWGRYRKAHDRDGYQVLTVDGFPAVYYKRETLETETVREWCGNLAELYAELWPLLRSIYAGNPGLPAHALPNKCYAIRGPFAAPDGVKWAQGRVGSWLKIGIPLGRDSRPIARWWFAEEVHSLLRGHLGVYGTPRLGVQASEAHALILRLCPTHGGGM